MSYPTPLSRVERDVRDERDRQDDVRITALERLRIDIQTRPRTGDECWEWEGNRDRDGYGVLTIERRQWRVNRRAYMEATGEDPGVFLVRHTCDNPACYRPDHLVLGTNQDNMDDKVSRGRCRNQYVDADQCVHGHPFTPENTYIRPGATKRQCRKCRREDNRRRRAIDRRPAGTEA